MKAALAALGAVALLSGGVAPVAQAELMATLAASWDSPPESVESGMEVAARIDWDANYAHGFIDDVEESSAVFDLTVENGRFLALPDQCADGSEWAPTSIRCVLDTPDDNGIAGHLSVPVRAWGSSGDEVSVTAVDAHGNTAATPKLAMTATAGIDVALNASGVNAASYRFDPELLAETTIPIMVSVPHGGEPLTDTVTIDLEFSTTVGPSIVDNYEELEVVAVPASRSIIGVAANGPNFEVPMVETERLDEKTLRVVAQVPNKAVGPAVDAAGNILDTIPVMSFGLELRYPVHSPSLNNQVMSWTARVSGVAASTASGPLTEQIRTTNDIIQTSLIDEGSVSAKFVNGHAPAEGGILAVPGDDPAQLPRVHREVWNPDLGTGVLSAGASNWLGRGPILPEDQMVGTVDAAHYVGMEPSDYVPGTTHGYCLIFDTERGSTSYNGRYSVTQLTDYRLEYLTGPIPGGFMSPDCGAGTWTTEQPADVTAMRILFDPAEQDEMFTSRPIFGAGYLASADLSEGARAWMAGGHSTDIGSGWNMDGTVVIGPQPILDQVTPLYDSTTTFRDAVEVVPYRTSVGLEASADAVKPGESVTWDVTTMVSSAPFANRGIHAVEHLLILPLGVEYVDASVDATVSRESGRDIVSWISDVTVGEPRTETIETVYRSGTGTLLAQVAVDNTMTERLRTDSDTAEIVALASAGTSLQKSAASDEFALDGSNQWTVTLANRDVWPVRLADTIDILPFDGDDRSTFTSARVTITDVTGAEVWVSTADPATIDPDPLAASNGAVGAPSSVWQVWDGQDDVTAIRWITRDLGPGMTVDYTIDYTVEGATNGDVLVNSAQTRTTGAMTTMINSSAATAIGEPADLQVDKRLMGSDAVLADGEELLFEITARGSGPGVVRDAVVADIPVAGLRDVTFVDATHGTVDATMWRIGDLPEGEIATATVRAIATGGTVENAVVGETCIDCVPVIPPECVPNVDVFADTDRCDVVTIDEQPILQVDKALPGAMPAEGGVTYSITVRNGATPEDGTVTSATLVQAIDLPGIGLETVAFENVSQGAAEGETWAIGTLRAGEEATATVTAALQPDAQRIVNAVSVRNPVRPRELTDPSDAIPNDDVYSDTDQADVVDVSRDGRLAVNKELDTVDGDTIRYTIEVGNLGGKPISGAAVTDIPGDTLSDVVLSDASAGTVDGLTWSVGDLQPGQVETIVVTGRISPTANRVVNEVFAEADGFPHGGTFIPNPTLELDTDQGDIVDVDVPIADLRLNKTVIDVTDRHAIFEIEVCNVGLAPATAVTVTDPGGANIVSLSSDDERFADGVFAIGTLDPGACEILNVVADITGSGDNVAFVDSPNDPLEDGADQPNDTIEDDIDGWDIVRFEKADAGAPPSTGRLPATGASTGMLALGALLLLGLGSGAALAAHRRRH